MLIVELTFHSPIFAETFEQCPETEMVVDSQHLLGDGTIQMLIWVVGPDPHEFEAALDADRTIQDYHRLTAEFGRVLYRIWFSAEGAEHSVHHRWIELGGTLLDAVGTHDGWDIRMRFPDRDAVRAFYQAFEEKGLDVTVTSLYTALDDTGKGFGLTEKQRDAIQLAFDQGYFEVPRRANLTDLASRVDVSRQSFSRRLTRGLHSLVENTIAGTAER